MGKLAIQGGPPLRTEPMPPRMAFGQKELEAVQQVFEHYHEARSDFGYQGHFEKLYTDAFVEFQGEGGFADAVATGTASIYVSLAALQLPAGSKVLVSPITDPGTLNAIILNQLVPVLMDSAPGSFNVGVEQFESRLSDDIKAILLVHSAGQAAPIDRISELAKKKGVYLIEDCSQAHGARLNGKRVGTYGDLAAFSTMYRKAHASGGCGGIIYTKQESFYRLARAYADRGKPFWERGFDDKDPGQFLFPALNLQTDELSCAIGLSSLRKLPSTIERRLGFLKGLSVALSAQCGGLCWSSPLKEGDSPFFHPIFVDTDRLKCSKIEFAKAVRAEGIDVNPSYMYVADDWAYLKPHLADSFICRNAHEVRDRTFNLLFNENYGPSEARDIVGAIIKVGEILAR